MKFAKSNDLLKRAKVVTPLGAQTYSKSSRYYCEGTSPSFIEKGVGAYVTDVDGNQYLDFVCALGPITIGYNDQRVNKAITEQLNKGIIFSLQSELEVQLAEKIVEIIPAAEMVRFVKNGADATSSAVKLARAYTNRDKVAVSGYHGMQDWYIGSTQNNKGVPKDVSKLTLPFNYNDLSSLIKLFDENKDQVAAVILEPIQGDGPKNDFLQKVKELANKNGAVLIFDEVVSGFRYALGGASELYNVVPDLVAFGKGMANGMPISAVAGKACIMKLIEEGVFISTTFGGEALSLASALATIRILEEPNSYKHVWKIGKLMYDGLVNLVDKYELGETIKVSGLAPHCGLLFENSSELDYLDLLSIYSQIMINNNILTVGINNINLAHTESDIKKFLLSVDEALSVIKQAITTKSTQVMLIEKKVNPVFKRNIR